MENVTKTSQRRDKSQRTNSADFYQEGRVKKFWKAVGLGHSLIVIDTLLIGVLLFW